MKMSIGPWKNSVEHAERSAGPNSGTALDTSVIVPALLAWHEHHAAALAAVQQAFGEHGPVLLPLPALVEAYAVMTRLPPPWRLAPATAHQLLDRTFRGRARLISLDEQDGWAMLDAALAQGVSGGATYDLHIAACARKARAARLVTFNRRHFERLDLGGAALRAPP